MNPLFLVVSLLVVSNVIAADIMSNFGGPDMHRLAKHLHLKFKEKGSGSFDLQYKGKEIWALHLGSARDPLILFYSSPYSNRKLEQINSWNDLSDFSTAYLKKGVSCLKASTFVNGNSFENLVEFVRLFTLEIDRFDEHLSTKVE